MRCQRVNQDFCVCYTSEGSAGNTSLNKGKASLLRQLWRKSYSILYVSWDFLDKLLSFINLRFDLWWLFVLLLKRIKVSGTDSSVSTTQIAPTHSWCLYAAAETCMSELNKSHRQTVKSYHCRRVLSGVTSLSEPSAPMTDSSRGSLCLLL